jgi:hypothetical protein
VARWRCSVILAGLLACAAVRAQVPLFPPPLHEAPPPEGVLLDCSLHRHGDRLDEALAATLKRFVALRSSSTLQAAARSGTRTDVTDLLYRRGLVQHVDGCSQPVVRGFVKGSEVQLQLIAVPRDTCLRLQASPALHAAGIDVLPVHDPTGEARCGMDRNPVPRILVFPFDARRMLPGNNTVTMVAGYAADCPSIDRNPDPKIEDMIATDTRVITDFPKRWTSPACIDWIGGASSMGVCTTAEWDGYHDRLTEEFERILALAVASRDVERVYSAAWWLIDKSDPDKFTIRGHDYKGRACDMLRNRIVAAWGLCAADQLKDALKGFAGTGEELKKVWDDTLEGAARCVKKIPEEYTDANDMIDALTRPMPFTAKRFETLEKVQGDVQAAMQQLGRGNCPYFGEAVLRLDYVRWKSQYRGGLTTAPPDWEHDFWDSAAKCAAGR